MGLPNTETIRRYAGKPAARKAAIAAAILLVLYTILGFFVLPPLLRSFLAKKLSETLHREVAVREIRFNPYGLALTVRGFEIKERGKPDTWISFDELYLDLESVSLLKMGIVVDEAKLVKPYVRIVRNPDRSYNFTDILEELAKAPEKPDSKPLKYSFNNIQLVAGKVDFFDGPANTGHRIEEMNIRIPFLSNLPYYVETYVLPSFSAKLNGRPMNVVGRTKPFKDSHETSFDVDLADIDIPYYLEYSPMPLKFRLPSAFLDVKARIAFTQFKDRPPLLNASGTVALKKAEVRDVKNAPVALFPLTRVAISSFDVTGKRLRISEVLVKSPELFLSRDKAGKLNLLELVGGKAAGSGPAGETGSGEKPGNPPEYAIEADAFRLADGKVRFSDMSGERPFRTDVDNIVVTADHFGNAKDKKTAFGVSLRTEKGEVLRTDGNFTMTPPAADGNIEILRLLPGKYSPYYHRHVAFEVESGAVDLKTGFRWAAAKEGIEAGVKDLSVAVSNLRLKKRGEDAEFLKIPALSVKGAEADIGRRDATIGEFATARGAIGITREKDGAWNLATLVPAGPPSPAPAGNPETGRKAAAGEKPFAVTVRRIAVDGYSVTVEDRQTAEPVTLSVEQIRLRAENLSNAKNRKGSIALSFRTGGAGTVSVSGSVVVDPLTANLKTDVKNVPIRPVQPYFTDRVKILITSGSLSSSGSVTLAKGAGEDVRFAYKGEAALADFASVDKQKAEDFLKFASLHLGGIDVGSNPTYANIAEIALTDFYSRLLVNADGTFNVQGIVGTDNVKKAGATEASPSAAPPPGPDNAAAAAAEKKVPVRIDMITLQGGTIRFSDSFVKPHFTANLAEIGGRISGLTSEEGKPGDVELRGKMENHAPLSITGRINPLSKDLYVQLKADFKDMELSPLTPYSGKYLGYAIQKGKLSFNLNYLVDKRKLDAQHRVFLDQFTLGEQIDSPEATKLPVRLAIALLKDRNGEISLEIPVSGSIDDPKFSVWGIVVKILLNLMVKAATSPFALLGAIFGGGEELGYLEFDYGSAAVSPQGAAKLNSIVKALHSRPALKLDVEGHIDGEKDRDGLQRLFFERTVKAQKLKEMAKKGLPAVPLDNVRIEPPEYPVYLKAAYKEGKFPKPRNIIGLAKDLPVPEMEKLLFANTPVTQDDLRQLAAQRARNAIDLILASKQVEPERVFLIEPKSLSPEKKEKVKDARTDFRLK